MADTILVTASLRMEQPAAIVRAQYRDIDHHIRNDVHPSIQYQWEPGAPGERKIRTKFRILGVPQYDVSLLEDGADGSFIIRYLEGTNAGMVLVHEFVELGPTSTDVRLFANAPATRGRKMLGPLFVAGARQVMKKALAEDKRDLERGSYVPGIAAGNVEGALARLSTIASRNAEAKRAVLDAACLLAAADGRADSAERDALGRLSRVLRAEPELPNLAHRIQHFAELADTVAIATEAARVGEGLLESELGAEGVEAAAVIALSSDGISPAELSLLQCVAKAAGLSHEALAATLERADENLSRRAS